MSELVDVVADEFRKLLLSVEHTYSYDAGLFTAYLDNRARRKHGSMQRKVLEWTGNAKKRLERAVSEHEGGFSFPVLRRVENLYVEMDRALPDVEHIIGYFEENLERSPLRKSLDRVRKIMPWMAPAAGALAAGAFYSGAYGTGGLYTLSAFSSWAARYPKITALASCVGNGAFMLAAFYLSMVEKNDDYKSIHSLMLISNGLGLPGVIASGNYLLSKLQIRLEGKKIWNTHHNFDQFMKYGVIISEARRNLELVEREVRKGAARGAYASQLQSLEKALLDYLKGEVGFDAVKAARIRCSAMPPASTSVKAGMTSDEYLVWKSAQGKGERSPVGYPEPLASAPVKEPYEETARRIEFSSDLAKSREGGMIAGYKASSLIDVVETKLQHVEQHEVVRKTTGGIHLYEKLGRKHDLPENASLFKMQPRGSLRALYTIHNGTIKVLDIMTHAEYDKMLK